MEIKNMTDTELVEAVAKEILEWENPMIEGDIAYIALTDNVFNNLWKSFDPFTDLNDLLIVLEKHDKWEIVRTAVYTVNIWIAPGEIKQASSIFLPRAVLEAALAAERSEK